MKAGEIAGELFTLAVTAFIMYAVAAGSAK
jgi:hypothetical protein